MGKNASSTMGLKALMGSLAACLVFALVLLSSPGSALADQSEVGPLPKGVFGPRMTD